MTSIPPPDVRPADARFSSGPTRNVPAGVCRRLNGALLGRSHRSKPGKAKLKEAIDRTRALLGVPDDFRIAIVPASDTGAMEMAMWSMLGARPVDVFAWESFGEEWVTDAVEQLKLADCRIHVGRPTARCRTCRWRAARPTSSLRRTAPPPARGSQTSTGFRRTAKVSPFNDATSAAFAQPIDWANCDVVTFSWQKVLGGEAAHGMLILSPRAVARLESYTPPRPLPKIFRMTKKGKLDQELFEGRLSTRPRCWPLRTISMRCNGRSDRRSASAARARECQRTKCSPIGSGEPHGSIFWRPMRPLAAIPVFA